MAELMTPAETLWSEINEAHALADRCSANARRAAGEAIQHAITCGGLLEQAKASVKHGEWEAERDKHFEGSDRTARLYQQLYNGRHHLESATVADLTLNGAAKLVSKAEREAKQAKKNDETLAEIDAAAREEVDPVDLGRIDRSEGEPTREPVEPDAMSALRPFVRDLVDTFAAKAGALAAKSEKALEKAEGSEAKWIQSLLGLLADAEEYVEHLGGAV